MKEEAHHEKLKYFKDAIKKEEQEERKSKKSKNIK